MGKRFTETNKWDDRWFRSLPLPEKSGWQYLCDKCDAAGVIDLDRDLADFQIGHSVDWDKLIELAGVRIEQLQSGKLWLSRFISFQYGKLSEECNAHRPVFASLEKHQLLSRVAEGYVMATGSHIDKDKDKDKEKEGGVGETKGKRFKAPTVDEVAAHCLERKNGIDAEEFVAHYESNGWVQGTAKKPVRDWKACIVTWEKNAKKNQRGSPSRKGSLNLTDGHLFNPKAETINEI
jgi:hypothetical protein